MINRAEYDDGWQERVEANLAEGNEVQLENFVYPDDEEICSLLARQYRAKVRLNHDKTICFFTWLQQ